jgi:hypothetical protein
VIKIYHLELLRASKGTLSRWSRLRSLSLAHLRFQGGTSGKRLVVKVMAESLSHGENMLYRPHLVGLGYEYDEMKRVRLSIPQKV